VNFTRACPRTIAQPEDYTRGFTDGVSCVACRVRAARRFAPVAGEL